MASTDDWSAARLYPPSRKSARRPGAAQVPHDARQLGVVAARQLEAAERVVAVRIESARHQYPIGGEVLDHATRFMIQRRAHHVARRSWRQGQIHRQPGCTDTPHLVGASGARIQRVLVSRDVENVGIVPKDRLGAVAMVHIPVEDEDAFTECRARRRRDGDVVHQAESHGSRGRGVMTRWAHRDEGKTFPAALEFCQRLETCPRGLARASMRSPAA